MHALKPLSSNSIPKALVRAKHYRLLNEPWQAESICRDILSVDSNNQKAILYLILAITDQFGSKNSPSYHEALRLCGDLQSPYEQYYYRGIINERLGKNALKKITPRAKYIAFEYYNKAMARFEEAEKIKPEGNEDSVLRWNACVRAIDEFSLEAAPRDETPTFLE